MRQSFWRIGFPVVVALVVVVAGGASARGMEERPSPQEAAEDSALAEAAGRQGGLVVLIGCENIRMVKTLDRSNRVIQGLDNRPAVVDRAREALQSWGLTGRASVAIWDEVKLPYVDNLVNLLVVPEAGLVDRAEMMRVLAPGGRVLLLQGGAVEAPGDGLVRKGGRWVTTVKPAPGDTDEWTHYLYSPGNNAVSKDAAVGPPAHMQWVAGPKYERSHDHLASLSAAVSAGGRLYYILDAAALLSVKLPARWTLVARDAYSGVELWRRPLEPWQSQFTGPRAVTADLTRKLVALGDTLYLAPGFGKCVTALDGATGRVLREYKGTEGANEILCDGKRLYLVLWDQSAEAAGQAAKRRGASRPATQRGLAVVDVASGRELWRKVDADTAGLMTMTLAAADGAVYYQNAKTVVSLDAGTGAFRWRADRPADHEKEMAIPTLVVYQDVVLSADNAAPGRQHTAEPAEGMDKNVRGKPLPSELIAYGAGDGKELWRCGHGTIFFSHTDLFVADGLVWTGNLWSVLSQGYTEAREPRTGKIVRRRPADQAFFNVGCSHHRCYKDRATAKYIVLGRSGVEFMDLKSGSVVANHWVRGTCQYGILPANGLLYAPPHPCACYIEGKLADFNALAPRRAGEPIQPAAAKNPLVPGRARPMGWDTPAREGDWATYRRDEARGGATGAAVGPAVERAWQAKLGGRLTAPVAAGGKVFVASIDAHTVYALEADTGKVTWSYVAGGRVDSPPTYYRGMVLFGCADGWVYCLEARDGIAVWRFRAAPAADTIVAYDQVESVWPVSGSVLVADGAACFAAGRTSYIDGGVYVYRLDAVSGKLLAAARLDHRDPKTGYQPARATGYVGFDLPGAIPDVMSAQDGLLYMRHVAFEPGTLSPREGRAHLFNAGGLLNDTWWHRTYTIIAPRMDSGFRDWTTAGNTVHAGEILSVTPDAVFGFGRNNFEMHGSHVGMGLTKYRLFAADPRLQPAGRPGQAGQPGQKPVRYLWTKEVPLIARAMAAAGPTLWIAGPPAAADLGDVKEAAVAIEGARGGLLWGVNGADGRRLTELNLESPPVFDGLIAANGRLYISCLDGRVECLKGK